MKPVIVRKGQGEILLEGGEITEIHAHTERLTFSIGELLSGQTASLDKGHKDAEEICYVSKGKIVMHLPGLKKYYLLNEGDSILIPPEEPHYATNVGEEKAITVWASPIKVII